MTRGRINMLLKGVVVALGIFALVLTLTPKTTQVERDERSGSLVDNEDPALLEYDTDDSVVEVPANLRRRAKKFMEAYYLANSNDTRQSRLERIRPYVAPALLAEIRLGSGVPNGLNRRGTVVMNQMTGSAGPGPNALVVNVPVVVDIRNTEGGGLESSTTVSTSTAWSKRITPGNPNGQWRLQQIA